MFSQVSDAFSAGSLCSRFPSECLRRYESPRYRTREPEIRRSTKDEARRAMNNVCFLPPSRALPPQSGSLIHVSPIRGNQAGKFNLVIDSRARGCRSATRQWMG